MLAYFCFVLLVMYAKSMVVDVMRPRDRDEAFPVRDVTIERVDTFERTELTEVVDRAEGESGGWTGYKLSTDVRFKPASLHA